jgi:hypothetical protein
MSEISLSERLSTRLIDLSRDILEEESTETKLQVLMLCCLIIKIMTEKWAYMPHILVAGLIVPHGLMFGWTYSIETCYQESQIRLLTS